MIPIKSQYISSPVKQCVICALQGNIDPKIYHKLTPSEKNLVRSVLPYFNVDFDDFDNEDSFNKRFEVIRGEILAGNNSNMLKKEAKQYLLHALNTSKISRHMYINLLQELDL